MYYLASSVVEKTWSQQQTQWPCMGRQRRRFTGSSGGGSGWNGSGGAPAKTSGLGYYDERPTAALEAASREASMKFRSRRDLKITWGPTFATYEGGGRFSRPPNFGRRRRPRPSARRRSQSRARQSYGDGVVVEEDSEDWQMGNAGAEAAVLAPGPQGQNTNPKLGSGTRRRPTKTRK